MGGSHRDKKGKGRRERQPFLKPSGVEWRGEKKSTDLGRNVWRSMRKSAGNETSVATGLWVLRQKHPDFEPAFSESALQRAIGIGAGLAARPLPHHRAYGSVHGDSDQLPGDDEPTDGSPSERK